MWRKQLISVARDARFCAQRGSKVQPLSRFLSTERESLDRAFRAAVQRMRAPATDQNTVPVTNEEKLALYALYKQSEQGPCTGTRPGMFDLVGRAKFDTWQNLGSMSSDKAKQQYVDLVVKLLGPMAPDEKAAADAAPSLASALPSTSDSRASAGGTTYSLSQIVSPRNQAASMEFSFIKVSIAPNGVAHVQLNRPGKGNAFNVQMWGELRDAMLAVSRHPDARVVVLSGAQGTFSTGMDLKVFADIQSLASKEPCEGRKREGLQAFISFLQQSVTSLEDCALPVIAAVSGHCIGGAIDVICAADMRFSTRSATFSVKEIDLAIVADMGTLQRLPSIVGHQRCAELTYTARTFSGDQAAAYGLVLEAFASEEEMMKHVMEVAANIASKSPLTTRGVKQTLLYARDHAVKESLDQVKLWNSALLQSNDLLEAATAMMEKRKPVFRGT